MSDDAEPGKREPRDVTPTPVPTDDIAEVMELAKGLAKDPGALSQAALTRMEGVTTAGAAAQVAMLSQVYGRGCFQEAGRLLEQLRTSGDEMTAFQKNKVANGANSLLKTGQSFMRDYLEAVALKDKALSVDPAGQTGARPATIDAQAEPTDPKIASIRALRKKKQRAEA